MASLTHLATKCRFAVLEVSDDEDEEKPRVGAKAGNARSADANSSTKANKKRKKKKSRAKNEQVVSTSETVSKNDHETHGAKPCTKKYDGWNEWMQKDEQFVLSQFQKDLKAALEASKQEQLQKKLQQQESFHDTSTLGISPENGKEKRKKEKPVVMSLDEFQMNNASEENVDSAKPEKQHSVTRLDDFSDLQGISALGPKEVHGNVMSLGASGNNVAQIEEKSPVSGKAVKISGRKRNNSHSETDTSNSDRIKQAVPEKKLLPATHEDQIQAEMVHIKDELDKTGHELMELRKAKAEHIQIIEDLKRELSQVKRRNKQLCFILSQAEMKEKSELLMQIEELSEVKEQVVQLHAELEQERSKNSALRSDMAKLIGGRQRHGSSS